MEATENTGAEYRAKALDCISKAQIEPNPALKAELRILASAYERLALHADRIAARVEFVFETPTSPDGGDGAPDAEA